MTICDSLRKGGQGEVMLGRLESGTYVAVKKLIEGTNNLGVLLDETYVISKIKHPNLIQLLSINIHQYLMVLELMK